MKEEANNAKPLESCYSICPSCLQIPLFQLIEQDLTITCEECKLDKKLSLLEYYIELSRVNIQFPKCEIFAEHQEIDAMEFCIKCKQWLCEECLKFHKRFKSQHSTTGTEFKPLEKCNKHNDQLFESFCVECKIHFCSNCLKEHESHQFINLSKYLSKKSLEKIEKNIDEADKYLTQYFLDLRDQYSDKLRQQIEKLEEVCTISLERNQDILKFAQMLLKTFKESKINNYYMVTNLLVNTDFTLEKFDENKEKKYDDLIKFYENNFILQKRGIKVLTDHNDWVNSLCILKDGRLASCSSDKTIRIFNIDTFKCEKVLEDHKSDVWYISQGNGETELLSCSLDKTVKIWDYSKDKNNVISTLSGHEGDVWKVIPLTNNRIASCSEDKKIKIWKNRNCEKNLEGHSESVVNIIQLKGREVLVSCSRDKTVKFWKLNDFSNEKTLEDIHCCSGNSMLEIENNKLLIGGLAITIVDTRNYNIELIEDNSLNHIYSLLLIEQDGSVLFGCGNGNLHQLLLRAKKQQLVKERAHQLSINAIVKIKENSFATCSYDKFIKIWS